MVWLRYCWVALCSIALTTILSTKGVSGAQDSDNKVSSGVITKQRDSKVTELVCPNHKTRNLPIFTLPCQTDAECKVLGEQCCNEEGTLRCRAGVPKPKVEEKHRPLWGLLPRECPTDPFTESFAVKNCTRDAECWPRICCQDGFHSYCRTAVPQWERVPRLLPLKNVAPYLQCTPPPPPLFDLFPKPCRTTVDCFPNLCCQEEEKKVCRPPRKSLLALIASVTRV